MTPQEAIKYLTEKGVDFSTVEEGFLDDYVHAAMDEEASDINNDGFESQLAYLLDGLTDAQAKEYLDLMVENEK